MNNAVSILEKETSLMTRYSVLSIMLRCSSNRTSNSYGIQIFSTRTGRRIRRQWNLLAFRRSKPKPLVLRNTTSFFVLHHSLQESLSRVRREVCSTPPEVKTSTGLLEYILMFPGRYGAERTFCDHAAFKWPRTPTLTFGHSPNIQAPSYTISYFLDIQTESACTLGSRPSSPVVTSSSTRCLRPSLPALSLRKFSSPETFHENKSVVSQFASISSVTPTGFATKLQTLRKSLVSRRVRSVHI